jgi:hypothetical protein
MKKILSLALAILFVFCGTVYLLIPKEIKISTPIIINCNLNAGTRMLMDTSQWKKWWPTSNALDQVTNLPSKPLFNGYSIKTTFRGQTLMGELIYAQLGLDSLVLFWNYQKQSSYNPFRRINDFIFCKALKENISIKAESFKNFLEKKEMVYGISIVASTVVDTLLVSSKKILPNYPTTSEIYTLVHHIQGYLQKHSASQTGFPMLNVTTLDSTHFQTMVAIPVNKKLVEDKEFKWKKMVPGNILIAEISGGDIQSKYALYQLHQYVVDYHLTSPAIPFYSLVTDRSLEKDSTKWITRIYYPVM